MKINPISGVNPIQPVAPVSKAAPAAKVERPQKVDEVDVSRQAMSISKLSSAVREDFEARVSEVRSPEQQSRINRIAREIDAGTYSVDAKSVADKLLKDIL